MTSTTPGPLVPPAIDAALPPGVRVADVRLLVTKLTRDLDRLQHSLDRTPWASAVAYKHRIGSAGAELLGALALARQATAALDLAADQYVLAQRRSQAARGRMVINTRKKVAALAGGS